MRVLGVDPGLTRCGVGIVDGEPGRRLTFVAAGVVSTPADLSHPLRLLRIDEGISAWLDEYQPDCVSIERVFAERKLHTITGTLQATGLVMVAAARRSLPVHLHTPTEVKAAISGSGRADKAQVGAMVTRILQLSSPPKPADAADAVALAICHLWRGAAADRIEAALARQTVTRRSA